MENLFLKGGIFMWPLLILLIVTVIITVERLLYWLKASSDNNLILKESLATHEDDSALLESLKEHQNNPALALAYQAVKQSNLSVVEIDNLLKQQQFYHARFMRLLDLIVSAAPLLGILGTIWGIINSFNLAGAVKDIEPSTAMLGISEAFITTAFGLIVSLLALLVYNYFQSRTERELVADDVFLTKIMVKTELQ